jgi:hypothetical protein
MDPGTVKAKAEAPTATEKVNRRQFVHVSLRFREAEMAS